MNNSPIAIIGIGCRFPGADDVEEFWRVLCNSRETTIEYPGGRFPRIDAAYARGAGIASRRGGFLRHLDQFDAEFFGISPREAEQMDPQQRLLLEVAWEAIEDAGIPAAGMAATSTGVFAGIWTSDYERALFDQTGGPDFYSTTGGGRYSASGRVAYFFDLRGPNLTVDTACSSSLAAIHLACQSLRLGESSMALAGGANVILSPEVSQTYAAAGMLSADGRSKFGDASADGYVRSEGAALLLLKPLGQAVADGDPVYAVIRGSAINNDGRSSSLLIAPSREGQEAMLRAALRCAGVGPGAVDYIEAHGTGTLVGDPVEIETVGRVVNVPERRRPCRIGSVKTNLGHTESAAGAAGVIKVALALQHGVLPASLHVREPNPAIPWADLPVQLQRETTPWPHRERQRLAGVSGFGITGTNVHVVLENFVPHGEPLQSSAEKQDREHLFVLSGTSPAARKAVAQSWLDRLQSDPHWPASLADLAYTAAVRRTHHDDRLAMVASTREELGEKLAAWLRGEDVEGTREGRRKVSPPGKVVFVYPGQGGQWDGMTRSLMREPAFRTAMEECDLAIRKHTGWSVVERLASSAAALPDNVAIVQPCLFAVMVALTALWKSWGIEPHAVVGHSMGESIAAWASGALSLEDAAAVICSRSTLMQRTSGRGLMAFAELTLDEASALAGQYGGRLSVAANNSPTSTVLSGDADAIEHALGVLTEREVFCRRIKVDVASHSSQMEPLRAELEEQLQGLRARAGAIPLYSTTSGSVEDGSCLDAAYWSRNLRQPVLFASAVKNLLEDGFDTFVEINAHPVLVPSIESGIGQAGRHAVVTASTRRDGNELADMLASLGTLFVEGFPVDFHKLTPAGACLRLPPYPWQRERYWIEVEEKRASATESLPPGPSNDAYALDWVKAESSHAAPGTAGLWIVAGRSDATPFTRILEASGHQCLRASNKDELARALETAGEFCRGVIRIASAAGADPEQTAAEAWEIVETVRAAAANPARLWLVSTGLWLLPGDSTVQAAQAAVWGLGRVTEREYPELHCVNVDLPAAPQPRDFAALALLVTQNSAEEVLAIRGGEPLVARYERVEAPPAERSLRADASYLVTGASGGIGRPLTRWLVERGARHLALVARRAPSPAMLAEIAALRAQGAEVRFFPADMAVDADCAGVLETIRVEMPALRGVFHLAAAYDPCLMANLDPENLRRVMRSKVDAAWLLDRHLQNAELDFFVLFSSIAAAISQPGLAAYASANACLEALARDRQTRGLPAQSIAWGSWKGTGLSTNAAVELGVSTYRQMGIEPVTVERALQDLGRFMTLDTANVLALPVAWDRFAAAFENGAAPRRFEKLLPAREQLTAVAGESIRGKLEAAEPARRRTLLEAHLAEKLASVLKTTPARIDPEKPFGLAGVDSLMALQFVRQLSATTSLKLPAALVFNYPTIRKLAREIAARMGIALEEALPAAAPADILAQATTGVRTTAETLTEEEAIAELMGRSGR